MRKIIFFFSCVIIISSCKKESAVIATPETSDQLLMKVVRTTDLRSIKIIDEVGYQYDDANKIIKEGNATYYRDNNERIVKIEYPPNDLNRIRYDVYYTNQTSGSVAYTLSNLKDGEHSWKDSIVYKHDEKNRLIGLVWYYSSENGGADLGRYIDFAYDANNNLTEIKNSAVNYGVVTVCSDNYFDGYDTSVNPLYSGDEVRVLEDLLNTSNASYHNFTNQNNRFRKRFTYRADGRPSSCIITDNGVQIFHLDFYYK